MTTSIDYSNYFKNYKLVNEFSYDAQDFISDMLVKNYRTTVYNINIENKQEVEFFNNIDSIMGEYIIDSKFFQFVQNELRDMNDNYIQDINMLLISKYENFQNDITGSFRTSRWI